MDIPYSYQTTIGIQRQLNSQITQELFGILQSVAGKQKKLRFVTSRLLNEQIMNNLLGSYDRACR